MNTSLTTFFTNFRENLCAGAMVYHLLGLVTSLPSTFSLNTHILISFILDILKISRLKPFYLKSFLSAVKVQELF